MPLAAGGRHYTYEFLEQCTQPKLFLTGSDDPFAPRDTMEELFRNTPDPKQMQWIAGAEHFFMGVPGSPEPKLAAMQHALRAWLHTELHLTPPAA